MSRIIRRHKPLSLSIPAVPAHLSWPECILILVMTLLAALLAKAGMPAGTVAELLLAGGLVGVRCARPRTAAAGGV